MSQLFALRGLHEAHTFGDLEPRVDGCLHDLVLDHLGQRLKGLSSRWERAGAAMSCHVSVGHLTGDSVGAVRANGNFQIRRLADLSWWLS